MPDIKQRLANLESRIAALENRNRKLNPKETGANQVQQRLIIVEVRNKRYVPENANLEDYQDQIRFDCYYTLSKSSKTTFAVKGLLEFADLFGEVRFSLQTTLNFPLEPGKVFPQEGIGFTYNQLMNEHQWMLATDLADMTFNFKPINVLYEDGTNESFI